MTSPLTKLKYVIRALGDEIDEDPYEFLAPGACGVGWQRVDDLDLAAGFGSRLAAERWMETNGVDMAAFKPVRRADVIVRPKAFQPELPDLVIKDPLEAVRTTHELHEEYCGKIERWLRLAGVTCHDDNRPKAQATVCAPAWAGCYSPTTNTCHYPVVYAMMASDWGPTVVAHECVHAYQTLFTGKSAGHGPDFYAMMRYAACAPTDSHVHTYPLHKALALAKKLKPWWAEQRQRGLLQSLPMEVVEQKMRRRGLK